MCYAFGTIFALFNNRVTDDKRRRGGRKMISTKRSMVLIAFVFFACVLPSPGYALLFDHFDGTSLSSDWSVSTSNVQSVTYNVANSKLTVSDISASVNNQWASVIFSQSFEPVDNYLVDFDFSWDSDGTPRAMQNLFLRLFDESNRQIGIVGYYDPWIDTSGSQLAGLPGIKFLSGYDTLSLSGSANVEVLNVDGNIDISWNGTSLLSGTSNASLARVRLEFSFYPYANLTRSSVFGAESVDLISDPVPTPEPGTLFLLSAGLLGLSFFSRKKNKHLS